MSVLQAAEPGGQMRIDWIRDLSKVESLRDLWVALENEVQHRTLYSRYDYVLPWYHCYVGTPMTDGGRPLVGMAWEDGELIGIAPMIEAHATFAKIPVRRVDCAGYNLSAGELLMRDHHEGLIEAFVYSLRDELDFEVIDINGLPLQSEESRHLHSHLRDHKVPVANMEYHWYAVADLSNGYDAYAKAKSSNFRKQTRKIARKVETGHDVQIERVTTLGDLSYAHSMRDRMFAIAERSWRTKRAGLEVERRHQQFYRELVDIFGSQDALDLAILVIDGRDAAFSLGLIERQTYYHTMIGYDDEMGDRSPGTYLLQEVFKYLPASGVSSVMSHGPYDYKKRWASEVIAQQTVCVFGHDLRARLAHWVGTKLARRLQSHREAAAADR